MVWLLKGSGHCDTLDILAFGQGLVCLSIYSTLSFVVYYLFTCAKRSRSSALSRSHAPTLYPLYLSLVPGGGTTDKEKKRLKPAQMIIHSQKVKAKLTKGGKAKKRKASNDIGNKNKKKRRTRRL